MFRQSPSAPHSGDDSLAAGTGSRGFRLVRYFSFAAALAFALVIAVLGFFQYQERDAFLEGQSRQGAMFRKAQERFAQQQDEAARRDLLAVHEAGSATLARVLGNTLWERELAPLLARAQAITLEACRPGAPRAAANDPLAQAQAHARRECAAEFARQLGAGREYGVLDGRMRDLLAGTGVVQARINDGRGLTIYSTESSKLGEDQAQDQAWIKAIRQGLRSSELRLGERAAPATAGASAAAAAPGARGVIVSHLPIAEPGSNGRVVAVLELHSDVSPFLEQMQGTASKIKLAAADNLAAAHAAAGDFQEQVALTANAKMVIVLVLLAALFGALYIVVRHADAVLARQSSARQLAQRQLVQAEKMASLGQMVAGVAHQLNTPLAFTQNNVRMAADRLREFELPLKVAARLSALVLDSGKDRVRLDISRAREQLKRVQGTELDVTEPLEMLADTLQGLEQMRELVDNLSDFTRLDRSKTAHCDINKALRNVIYVARGVVPSRVQVVERYSDVPSLRCNLSQLNQVFLNLISNAAQAIEGEGLVTVSTRSEGATIIVDVADTGSGIAPEVLPHIFDDYFTTKPAGEGTGLGLPIARGIVHDHGGEITVDTRVGAGSVFTVRLPCDPEAVEAAEAAATAAATAAAAAPAAAPAALAAAAPVAAAPVISEMPTLPMPPRHALSPDSVPPADADSAPPADAEERTIRLRRPPRPSQPSEPDEYKVV